MDDQPLVTVVTPSLNSGGYIRNAIESVRAQDYPRIEHIVVDGGSRDDTHKILAQYPGIIAQDSLADNGAAHAINEGFKRSTGSIFGWLNADDTYLPGAVKSAVKLFQERPDLHVIYGKAFWIDKHGELIGSYPTQSFRSEALTRECIISQPACFIRSSAFYSIGMLNSEEKFTFDYDLWIRMAGRFNFEHILEYWANSRMHSSSITFTDRRRVLEANMKLLERHYGYVPLQWIYGYCSYMLDSRDQFFEPLRYSMMAYILSLPYGLARNHKHRGRFITDWMTASLSAAALKGYLRGLTTRRNGSGRLLKSTSLVESTDA